MARKKFLLHANKLNRFRSAMPRRTKIQSNFADCLLRFTGFMFDASQAWFSTWRHQMQVRVSQAARLRNESGVVSARLRYFGDRPVGDTISGWIKIICIIYLKPVCIELSFLHRS